LARNLTTPYRWLLGPTASESQTTPFVGELVGRWEEGSKDGKEEGPEDGADDGDDVGSAEGNADGPDEGAGVATGFLVGVAEARATVGVGATRILRAGHFIIIIIAIIFWLLHMPLPPALPSRSLGARIPLTKPPEAAARPGSPPGGALAATAATAIPPPEREGGPRRASRKGAIRRITLGRSGAMRNPAWG
jgi:hypothetical protein